MWNKKNAIIILILLLCIFSFVLSKTTRSHKAALSQVSELEAQLKVCNNSKVEAAVHDGQGVGHTPPVQTSPVRDSAIQLPTHKSADPTSAAEIRVRAIEKVVDITPEQKARLLDKYKLEREDPLAESESLEDIIGEEQAATYRTTVQDAFDRSRVVAAEKEAYYLSRILNLTPTQEQETIAALLAAEEAAKTQDFGGISGMQLYLERSKYEDQFFSQKMAEFLNPPQLDKFQAHQAESPAADLQTWH